MPKSSCIAGPRPTMPQNSSRRATSLSIVSRLRAALDFFRHAGQQLLEPCEVDRLAQIVHRAELDGIDGGVDRRVAGHQHGLAARIDVANGAQHVEPADVGHAQIDQDQVGATRVCSSPMASRPPEQVTTS